jgi:Rod binding domain-containing protein
VESAGIPVPDLAADRLVARARAATGCARGSSGPQQAAREFEMLLATMLVREMRRSLGEGFFGGGAGADVFEGWLDEHLGASLTAGPGLGLREVLAGELSSELRARGGLP